MALQIKIETGETLEFTEPQLKFIEPDGSALILTPDELVEDTARMKAFLDGAYAARIVEHTDAGPQIYYSRSLRLVEAGEPLPPAEKPAKGKGKKTEPTPEGDTSQSEEEEKENV